LREAIERARRSSFYAERLAGRVLQSRTDLSGLPLTFKQDLAEASPYGMLAVPASKAWHYHETAVRPASRSPLGVG
jgi:phenylacetate-coenzyme A ligase PaaK-like adenylate-forming protein